MNTKSYTANSKSQQMRKRSKWDVCEWAEWGFKITPILREVLRESIFDQWLESSHVSRDEGMILFGKLELLNNKVLKYLSRYCDLLSTSEELNELIDTDLKPLLQELEDDHKRLLS